MLWSHDFVISQLFPTYCIWIFNTYLQLELRRKNILYAGHHKTMANFKPVSHVHNRNRYKYNYPLARFFIPLDTCRERERGGERGGVWYNEMNIYKAHRRLLQVRVLCLIILKSWMEFMAIHRVNVAHSRMTIQSFQEETVWKVYCSQLKIILNSLHEMNIIKKPFICFGQNQKIDIYNVRSLHADNIQITSQIIFTTNAISLWSDRRDKSVIWILSLQ